jgi:hypothetical protein
MPCHALTSSSNEGMLPKTCLFYPVTSLWSLT